MLLLDRSLTQNTKTLTLLCFRFESIEGIARMEKGGDGRLEVVVSYSYGLEARVNFYVEAVNGYDDTTDCSVRRVVYRGTIR